MSVLRVGIVGAGPMGRLHARTVGRVAREHGGCELVGLADHHPGRAETVAGEFGGMAFEGVEALAERVDAVIVAVPTAAHFEIAASLLERGVDLLVEKPLAANVLEGERLVGLARRHARIVQVGHVEWFNVSWREAAREVGPIRKIEVERMNPVGDRGLDVDVVQDLMLHDLDWVTRLIGEEVVEIQATGRAVIGERLDQAEARLCFSSGRTARLLASRLHDGRRRFVRIEGRDGIAIADLSTGVVSREDGRDVNSASASAMEPLEAQWHAFVAAVRSRQQAENGGEVGLAALRLVERVRETIKGGEAEADLDDDSRFRR